MKPFGTAEVSRLADIPVRSLRAMVRARYVLPSRGPRNALRVQLPADLPPRGLSVTAVGNRVVVHEAGEQRDADAAVEAYRHCVARHGHSGACANLGRLLHLQGRIDEALSLYQAGDQSDPDVLYNQGVALEDLGRNDEAIAAYERVTALQLDHLDAHHNLARLWQQAGNERRALRHWNAYRRLLAGAIEP